MAQRANSEASSEAQRVGAKLVAKPNGFQNLKIEVDLPTSYLKRPIQAQAILNIGIYLKIFIFLPVMGRDRLMILTCQQ